MARRWVVLAVIFAVLFCGFSSVSALPTSTSYFSKPHLIISFLLLHLCLSVFVFIAEIVAGVLSKAVSALVSWIWAIRSASNTGLILFLVPNFGSFLCV